MAAGATYEPIATTTLTGSASTLTFSSIPSTYTDLKFVWAGSASNTQGACIRFNGDTGTNYSRTGLSGDGAVATSYTNTSTDRITAGSFYSTPVLFEIDVFSYAGSTYKTILIASSQDANGSGVAARLVGLWRSTSAINSFTFYGFSGLNLTGTATLYGIKAA